MLCNYGEMFTVTFSLLLAFAHRYFGMLYVCVCVYLYIVVHCICFCSYAHKMSIVLRGFLPCIELGVLCNISKCSLMIDFTIIVPLHLVEFC